MTFSQELINLNYNDILIAAYLYNSRLIVTVRRRVLCYCIRNDYTSVLSLVVGSYHEEFFHKCIIILLESVMYFAYSTISLFSDMDYCLMFKEF